MTPDEIERNFQDQRAALIAAGYTDLRDLNGLTVGARVRHVGEQFAKAHEFGTATVLALMENVDSSWSKNWHQRDIELLVRKDEPAFPEWSPISQWANYHARLAEDQPKPSKGDGPFLTPLGAI